MGDILSFTTMLLLVVVIIWVLHRNLVTKPTEELIKSCLIEITTADRAEGSYRQVIEVTIQHRLHTSPTTVRIMVARDTWNKQLISTQRRILRHWINTTFHDTCLVEWKQYTHSA